MIDYERMKKDLLYKADFVWNALSCKSVHGLDGYDNWEDSEGRSAFDDCDNCAYCCGEPNDCDLTELIHDAMVVVGELRNEYEAMQKRLKAQEEQVKQWTKEIADNQLAHAPNDSPMSLDEQLESEYKRGIWDGLQIAWNIISEGR